MGMERGRMTKEYYDLGSKRRSNLLHNLFPNAWGLSQSFKQNKCPSSTYSSLWGSIILSNAKDAVELVIYKSVIHWVSAQHSERSPEIWSRHWFKSRLCHLLLCNFGTITDLFWDSIICKMQKIALKWKKIHNSFKKKAAAVITVIITILLHVICGGVSHIFPSTSHFSRVKFELS